MITNTLMQATEKIPKFIGKRDNFNLQKVEKLMRTQKTLLERDKRNIVEYIEITRA